MSPTMLLHDAWMCARTEQISATTLEATTSCDLLETSVVQAWKEFQCNDQSELHQCHRPEIHVSCRNLDVPQCIGGFNVNLLCVVDVRLATAAGYGLPFVDSACGGAGENTLVLPRCFCRMRGCVQGPSRSVQLHWRQPHHVSWLSQRCM